MANNAVTVSQLPQTNTVISTDRIVVLYNASGNTAYQVPNADEFRSEEHTSELQSH